MTEETKFLDLRLNEKLRQGLLKATSLSNSSSVLACDAQGNALQLLVGIQKEVAPKWRMHILRVAHSSASESGLQDQVVQSLPMAFQVFGNSFLPLCKELFLRSLERITEDGMANVTRTAARVICVLSQNVFVRRRKGDRTIICKKCHRSEPVLPQETAVDAADIEFILQLIGLSSARANIASLVESVSNHVGFTPTSVSLWTPHFEPSNKHFVGSFAGVVKYFVAPACTLKGKTRLISHANLPGWSNQDEVIAAVVSKLKDLCDVAKISNDDVFIDSVCSTLKEVGETQVRNVQEPVTKLMVELLLCSRTHVHMFCAGGHFLSKNVPQFKPVIMEQVIEKLSETTTKGKQRA